MGNSGIRFISKMTNEKDAGPLKRYDLKPEHFESDEEREWVRYIMEYAKRNRGRAPSAEEMAAEFGNTFADAYVADVPATFESLAREIKSDWAEREFVRCMKGAGSVFRYNELFEKYRGVDLVKKLADHLERIIAEGDLTMQIGHTLGQLSELAKREYIEREEGKSFKCWGTPFESLNKEIGGLYTGGCYGVLAESGRGKSYLICKFADSLLRQGATILWKSYELEWYVIVSRLASIATAVDGAFVDQETKQKIGIANRAILRGDLDPASRKTFFDLMDRLEEYYPGRLFLQAKMDEHITYTLDDLERELSLYPEIDVLIVDPFENFEDVYAGRNVNKVAGGAAAAAAKRFENIVAKHKVVGIYAVQAELEYTKEEKEKIRAGMRELKLPTRDQVKTTKQLLNIATNLFSFDNVNGHARIGTDKGRHGGEGFYVDLIANLDHGVLEEPPGGERVRDQFTDIF